MKKILILTDGKAGHENQSKAFVRALGCEGVLAEVHFKSKFAKALSYALDRLGMLTLGLFNGIGERLLVSGEYAAVVGTGSGTFYAAKAAAKRMGVKCGVVLYPRGYRISSFDCVLAPTFDRPPAAANVVKIPANLVANDDAFYANGVKAFDEHYRKATGHEFDRSRAAIAVIIGGPNKCSTMTADWTKRQLDAIFELKNVAKSPVEFWVTTSRRTPLEVEKTVDSYPFDYKLLYSKDHFNPIPAFVKLASKLYVSAESTGMLSEACTFGDAEVVALDNLLPGMHKFRRFVEDLRSEGYVDGNRKVRLEQTFSTAKNLLRL